MLASREAVTNPRQLVGMLESNGITVLQATPATWRGLLAAEWNGSPRLKILCGGEPMTADLAEQLLKRCATLWNVRTDRDHHLVHGPKSGVGGKNGEHRASSANTHVLHSQ